MARRPPTGIGKNPWVTLFPSSPIEKLPGTKLDRLFLSDRPKHRGENWAWMPLQVIGADPDRHAPASRARACGRGSKACGA